MTILSSSCSLVIPIKKEKPKQEINNIHKVKLKNLPAEGEIIRRGRGVFIKTVCNTEVYSTSPGIVIYSGNDIKEYNWLVIVQREDGVMHVYGNLSEAKVSKKERIKKGTLIGFSGKDKYGTCGVIYEIRTAEGDPLIIE